MYYLIDCKSNKINCSVLFCYRAKGSGGIARKDSDSSDHAISPLLLMLQSLITSSNSDSVE